MMFRDQVGILTDWFKGWNECEQTVALLSLLKRVSRTQARFLHICLEHWLADCTEIHILEAEANNAGSLGLNVTISQYEESYHGSIIRLIFGKMLFVLFISNCQPVASGAKRESGLPPVVPFATASAT